MTPALAGTIAETVVAIVRSAIAAARPDAEVIAAARDAIAKALAGDEAAAERMRAEWRERADALWPAPPAPREYVGGLGTPAPDIYPPDED